eukprot:CAMPEP_0118983030 /NCGR_PEP_ID=MMETSP1173-20130426/34376_1 /TAXON_ID=1034831 /ORGANISM="Rhizochromulina marina cf, Strain CCMP1243" /LENGTH=49 /DNA_ID= /DNA_START= /DNA_END= /DNA_ORIENTATION=
MSRQTVARKASSLPLLVLLLIITVYIGGRIGVPESRHPVGPSTVGACLS